MLAYLDTLIGFAVVMLGVSLLITILTQMVSALLSHRGANLRWGLVTLFRHVPNCPLLNTAQHAEMIARDVLSHPLISDSIFSIKLPIPVPRWIADRFRLATAINPDELVAILKDLSSKPAYQVIQGLPEEIESLISAQNPAVERRLALLASAPALSTLPVASAVPLLQDTLKQMKDDAGKLEAWFNATMERVSSRFSTYARLWTVAFSLTFALVTGLNSVTLLSALYTNGDFRQQVTGAGQQVMGVAERNIPNPSSDVLAGMYAGLVNQALATANAKADETPQGLAAYDTATKWITDHVADPTQRIAAVTAFNNAFLNQRYQDAAALRNILSKSSFDVLQFRWDSQKPVISQLPGVLATAALLSLGAPFWFNLLKQASNLRPILADKQDSSAK